MPDREYNPAPEDFEIEIDSFLAGFVHCWVEVDILVIDILLKRVREEAGEAGP